MKKHLPIIVPAFLIIALVLSYAAYIQVENRKLETRERLLLGKKAVMEQAFEAQRVWLEGNSKGVDQNCQDLDVSKYPDAVIRRSRQCSADYLQCWLSQLEGEVKALPVHEQSLVRLEFNGTGKKVIFSLSHPASGHQKIYQLADTCRDVYLPQGRYAVGPLHPSNNDWQWDNFDQAIFIDKNPVSVRDVREWLKWADFDGLEKPELSLIDEPLAPAARLLAEQQELFCAFHGGFLLPAHFYDAASFFPPLTKDQNKRIPRGPFPEGRRRQDNYLGLQMMTGELIVLNQLCRSFYSQECSVEEKLFAYSPFSVSWMGIHQVLGGEFEHLSNPRELRRNIKLSSRHYPMMSKWHQIGERGYWDGAGFERTHFNWRTQDPEADQNFYGVTFRCARLGRLYAP